MLLLQDSYGPTWLFKTRPVRFRSEIEIEIEISSPDRRARLDAFALQQQCTTASPVALFLGAAGAAMQHQPEAVSTCEREFIASALAEGVRADGRGLSDARSPRVTLGPAAGTAEVRLGDTKVLAVVSAELIEPFADRPTEGTFALSVELSPMASPAFETGRPTPAAVELSRMLERAIVKSHAVDLEAMCVLAGKRVWAVRCDVTALDDCGNLIDACTLAAGAALRHFRKPYVSVHHPDDGEGEPTVVVHAPDSEEPEPLALHHTPVAVSFALVEAEEGATSHVVLDPTEREEAVATGLLTVVLNRQGQLCALHKPGGAPVGIAQLRDCTATAAKRVEPLLAAVDAAMSESPPGTQRPPAYPPPPLPAAPDATAAAAPAAHTLVPEGAATDAAPAKPTVATASAATPQAAPSTGRGPRKKRPKVMMAMG